MPFQQPNLPQHIHQADFDFYIKQSNFFAIFLTFFYYFGSHVNLSCFYIVFIIFMLRIV